MVKHLNTHCSQDAFVQELEEIHESYQEDELMIEGEFASEATMVEWRYSQSPANLAIGNEFRCVKCPNNPFQIPP